MPIRTALILDLETTGLDRERDAVVEVAAVLVDLERLAVVTAYSTIVHAEENAAEHVNGLSPSLLREHGESAHAAWENVAALAKEAGVILAHRAAFDYGFVCGPSGAIVAADARNWLVAKVPWACTKFGIDWPKGRYGGHLVDLALAHGVAVPAAHRALDDCLLLARLMFAAANFLRDEEKPGRVFVSQLVEAAVERGVGEPNRCQMSRLVRAEGFGQGEAVVEQCSEWARSYDLAVRFCPKHGGPFEWVRLSTTT